MFGMLEDPQVQHTENPDQVVSSAGGNLRHAALAQGQSCQVCLSELASLRRGPRLHRLPEWLRTEHQQHP
jgi:hypothetical protein